jgi:hypothetical protein
MALVALVSSSVSHPLSDLLIDCSVATPDPPDSQEIIVASIGWNATQFWGTRTRRKSLVSQMTFPPCPIFLKYFSMSYRCNTSRFRYIYYVYDIPEFSDAVYRPGKPQSAPLLTPSSSLPTPLPILHHALSRYTYYPPVTIYLLHPPDYSIYVSRTSSTLWHPPPFSLPISLFYHLGLLYSINIHT